MHVQGWFTFKWLYDWAARSIAPAGHTPIFVEVGVWKGASLIYLAKALRATGRPFRLAAVDTWGMDPAGPDNEAQNPYLLQLKAENRTLYRVYRDNLEAFGVSDLITDIRLASTDAARCFKRADFVFIDADHSAAAVEADVNAWRPKAGLLAGHDVCCPSVWEGLVRALGRDGFYVLPLINCWVARGGLASQLMADFDAAMRSDEARRDAEGLLERVKRAMLEEHEHGENEHHCAQP